LPSFGFGFSPLVSLPCPVLSSLVVFLSPPCRCSLAAAAPHLGRTMCPSSSVDARM
jgi:hypothetical protein